MNYMLAVDPDTTAPGLALFEGRPERWTLIAAGRCKGAVSLVDLGRVAREWVLDVTPAPISMRVGRVAVEWPRVYPAGHGKAGADPNDLIALAGAAVGTAAGFPYALFDRVAPRDWKGTLRKPKCAAEPYVVEERVIDRLTPFERAVWGRDAAGVAPTPRLEITDAVGIGLHAAGRGIVTTRVRVIAR